MRGLLAALRDEGENVRSSAASALGEVSKDRKSKLPEELSWQFADTLRDMLDDPRNQKASFVSVGWRLYTKPADVIWEALWLMCQRIDEQRG